MLVGGHLEVELLEDLGDVGFDSSFTQEDPFGDSAVAEAFGDEREHFLLSRCECCQRTLAALAPDHSGHDGGIDDGVSVSDSLESIDEDRDVEHAVLEQVPDFSG